MPWVRRRCGEETERAGKGIVQSEPGWRFLLALALAGLTVGPASAQLPGPVGGEFQVNSVTAGAQSVPDVTADAGGNYVVVWESSTSAGNDASARSIQARRYRADGAPVAAQFQVNTQTLGEQIAPAVAMAPDGRFVVAWASDEGGGGPVDFDIRARLYAANGTPAGTDFLVNTFDVGDQRNPDLAWAGNLGFAVVWESDDDTGPNFEWNIIAQVYNGSGAPQGEETLVDSLAGGQFDPAIAGNGAGQFVVAWESFASDGSDTITTSIQAKFLGPAIEVQVNDHPPVAPDDNPAIALGEDGAVLVAWESGGSAGTDNSLSSIQARRYDAAGDPGPVFQVNQFINNSQRFPAVALLPDDRFAIAWHSFGSLGDDASEASVQVRGYLANGVPYGPEVQANVYTTDNQHFVALTATGEGGIVAAWASFGSSGDDNNSSSVQARRFSLDLLFADGFETNSTIRWSATVL